MIRLRPLLVRSPLAVTLALTSCQPVAKPGATDEGSEPVAGDLLIRAIPDQEAVTLVFPPPTSARHARADLVLDDEEGTLGLGAELKVRSPYLDDDKSFDFRGRSFRVVLTHEIELARKPSVKRPLPAAEGTITIDPPIAFKAAWSASNVLEITADDHLDPEKKYTLTIAGLKSAEGLELKEPWVATFTAEIAFESAGKTLSYIPQAGESRVISIHPLYGDRIGKRETLAVVFDQAIDLTQAAAQIRLSDGNGERPFKVSHSRGARFQGVKVDPKQVVIVRPERAFASGEALTLEAWDFDQSAGAGQSREFSVAVPLELSGVTCGYSYDSASCEWNEPVLKTGGRDIWLNFNNGLSEKDGAAKSKVSVSPAVANLSVWVTNGWDGDGQLRISGDFKPSSRYTINVQPLRDRFGSTIPATSLEVETAALPASVSMSEGALILDEEHSRDFVVTTRNVARGELRFWAVADGDAEAFKRARSQVDSRTLPSGAAEVVIPFSPDGVRDDFVKTSVDLLGALRPGKTYVATVELVDTAYEAAPIKHPSWSSASRPPVVLVTPGDARSLAVHTHALTDATVLHVARLKSGAPVVGANVRVNGEVVRGRVTDANGVVVLPIGLEKARAAVIGVDDGQGNQAQVQLSAEGSRERSYFPDLTSSAAIRTDDRRAMVITDRGIYRPGSTVWIKGSVRQRQGSELVPVASLPVKVRVLGPMEDEVMSVNAVTNDMGSVAVQFDAPDKARLGEYQVRVEDALSLGSGSGEASEGGLLAASFVKIAEFEPPRFTVDVEAKSPKERAIVAKVVGRYLFGAPMDGADVEWTLTRSSADLPSGPFTDGGFAFDARRSWYWWDEDGEREDRWSRADRAKLGEDGTLTIRQDLDLGKAISPQRFTLEADVADTSYRHVAGRDGVVVHPFERYVGVKLPRPWTSTGGPVEVALGVIDQAGKPVAGAEVTAHLERIHWTYTKTRSSSGYTHYDWHVERSEVDSCTATSATQAVNCTLTPTRGGEYAVITEVDGHRGGEASFWAWGDDGDEVVFPSKGRTIDVIADKSKYAPGETARLMVRSPFAKATAILTLEQGGLLTHQTVEMESNTHLFEVPITAAHAPQLHAVVTLLPIDAPAESKAEWKIGAIRLPVSLKDASLGVSVSSDKESYEPGDQATITVVVKDGSKPREGAEIALAVVDEGILRLTNFHAADPVKVLRPGMPLRFEVSDTRNSLAALLGLSKTAGDGMAGDDSANARKNFLETALWRPDLRTDGQGKAEVTFALPDNLTRFRMMAVVLDQRGKGGNAEESFTVRKPLMMIPAVPRFAAVGDAFEAAAMVHNNEERAQKATVSLGGQVQEIELAAAAHRRIAFPLVADKAGDLALDFAVKDSGGKTRDAVQVVIPVDAPGVAERPILDGAFVGEQRVDVKVPTSALVGKDTDDFIAVKVGQHLWPELGARLEFLLGYPHGCVEQTTSGVLPLLAAREILPRIGFTKLSKEEIDKRIKSGLDRLATMKTYSGGLGYWPGDSSPNVYGTAYAIRALITAKKAGIAAPAGLLEGMSSFLGDQLLSVSEPEVQAAIAQSLAELGELPASSLDALYDRKDRQGVFGLASLAIAFGSFGDQEERTRELLDLVEASFDADGKITQKTSPEDFYYYGSPVRSKAQAAIALGRLRKGSTLYHKLLRELSNVTATYTTQPTAYSLLAVSEQLAATNLEGAKFDVSLDGAPLTSVIDLGGGSFEFRIPLADLRGREAKLELSSTSKAAIAFMVSGHWKRALADAGTLAGTTADNGPELYRVVTDAEGNPVDLAHVSPGQVLRVSLLAKLPVGKHEWGRMSYMALTDRLPAGFEAVQTDLWTVARAPEVTDKHPFYNRLRWGGSDASFIELHDERVNVYFDRVWGDEVVATYLVRSLTPGTYTHPPAEAEFMYIPDSTSYSDAGKVVVE